MSRSAAAHRLPQPDPFTGGPPPGPRPAPRLSNARIAIIMLMAAETMLFTGLVSAHTVLKQTAVAWPPPGQPRLPLTITWVNTFVLFLSCWTMTRAWSAQSAGQARRLRLGLWETFALGATFLAIQGSEWVRLLGHGLGVSTSLYGATFYTLIGLHGLHVLAAVIWLLVVALRFDGGRFSLERAARLDICAMYWFYVCGLWAVLFPLVYLF